MLENRYIYIVEGKNDYNKLFNLGFKYILITNGRNVDSIFLNLLLKFKNRTFVILTDPDFVGLQLRNIIENFLKENHINYISHQFDRKECKNKKIGLENAKYSYLKEDLKKFLDYEKTQDSLDTYLSKQDFDKLLLDDKENKKRILKYYNLEKRNNIRLLAYLNMSKIDKDKLIKMLEI